MIIFSKKLLPKSEAFALQKGKDFVNKAGQKLTVVFSLQEFLLANARGFEYALAPKALCKKLNEAAEFYLSDCKLLLLYEDIDFDEAFMLRADGVLALSNIKGLESEEKGKLLLPLSLPFATEGFGGDLGDIF